MNRSRLAAWLQPFLCSEKPIAAPDGTIIGSTERGEPIIWPAPSAQRNSHSAAVGRSGSGKTLLLINGCISEWARHEPPAPGLPDLRPSLEIFDGSKGDTARRALQAVAEIAPHRLKDVRIIDARVGFPLNIAKFRLSGVEDFHMLAAELLGKTSGARGDSRTLGIGAKQVMVMANVLEMAFKADHPNPSVLLALAALSQRKGLERLKAISRAESARAFFSQRISEDLRASCAMRLFAALPSERIRASFGAPTILDFRNDLCAPGRLVIFDVSGAPLVADLLVRLLALSLMSRPAPYSGAPTTLLIDEIQLFPSLGPLFDVLLSTSRAYGIQLCLGTQSLRRLAMTAPGLGEGLVTNVAELNAGRLSPTDARTLAAQAPTPRFGRTPAQARTQLETILGNLRPQEFVRIGPGVAQRFRATTLDLDQWEQAYCRVEHVFESERQRYAITEPAPPLDTLLPPLVRARRSSRTEPRLTSPSTSRVTQQRRSSAPPRPDSPPTTAISPEPLTTPEPLPLDAPISSPWG